jgi:hypothetical protein
MWDHAAAIIAAVFAGVAAVLSAINRGKINEVHVALNSRLTQLIDQTSKAAHAEGVVQGTADATKEQK